MGRPRPIQSNPKKDNFFIGKKRNKPGSKSAHAFNESFTNTNAGETNHPFSHQSSGNSGNFFVTPSEKQQILQEKEAKRNARQKFKPKQEEKTETSHEKVRKPFDKKKYRLQKYSKKYKLEQWEEKRKKGVLREYYTQIKDDEPKFDVQKIYEQYQNDDDDDDPSDSKPEETKIVIKQTVAAKIEPEPTISGTNKKKAFRKAHVEYERIQEEKKLKKEEFVRKKAEKAEALKEYKEKKLEKYKKLNKKTKKGQPIMKYRMEMLLEQIQKSVK